ncbi:MAG TPA: AraC family transcriptional regulator [Chitinophagaceae bacterium]|nr:AraC family transcriptional regulator [Chitinophagaceae bacterium]
MELNIKNMVCARCIKTVLGIFQQAGADVRNIKLGSVETSNELETERLNTIRQNLANEGFELLDDQKMKLIEQIKNEIINLVHYGELDELKVNLSTLLSGKLHKDYNYLSTLFSSVESTTIEQYFILQKIEKVKELLVYDELSLSQIAFKLGYSSVAHLSNQFKKVTGFTPSEFKKQKGHHRNHLDKL